MAESPPRRRPVWKILVTIVAVLFTVVGSAAIWIRSVADRKWAAMEERLKALAAAARVPDADRRPGSVPGNAWDDYTLALADAGMLRQSDRLIGLIARTKNADPAFGEAALSARSKAIDLMIQGSRRASCIPPLPDTVYDVRHWDTLVRLATLKARAFIQNGKRVEGLQVQLALCQFGRDLADGGALMGAPYFGLSSLEKAFDAIRDDARPDAMTLEELSVLESRLALLDESLPNREQLRRSRNLFLGEFFRNCGKTGGWTGWFASWRFGFSSRLMAASAFEDWDRWNAQALEADRLPWPQARSRIAAIRAEIDARPREPFGLPPEALEDGSFFRTVQAHLRLLRIAAHYRRTGKVLDLDDPFGAKLLHQESGGRLKVWSVGIDGVDAQGKGTWDSRVIEDIVLDVPR